jgi:hypothetical protein
MISSKKTQNLHLPHDTRSCQDLHKINKLEPATRDNLIDSVSAIREHVIHVPYWAKDMSMLHKDHQTR